MSEELDNLTKEQVLIIDPTTRKIMRIVDPKTSPFKTEALTEEECAKKFRKHEDCGGWFMHMLDHNTFHVSSECTKCGMKEDKNKKCDKCVE